MKVISRHVSASEDGDDYCEVLFEEERDADGPYLLIQRAFELEDEAGRPEWYVETHDERLRGHFRRVKAKLTRDRFLLRLSLPLNDTIEVDFSTSEKNFQNLRRILRIILGPNLTE